ncbi:tape measure protein [Serratia fonticola]|uniref:tape measure protein n=1 Tax=Serratia fonticola TaxID=47917 RepID=UPI001377C2F9|nr:tape measure protein [Serratia fonticola]NCG53839.1 tape measure protein [Serratia fonticola]
MGAGNSTLNLALRITADMAEAKQSLEALAGEIKTTGENAATSNQQLQSTVVAQNAAAEAARQQAQSQQTLNSELNTSAVQNQRAARSAEEVTAAWNAQSARGHELYQQEQKLAQSEQSAAKAAEAHSKEVDKLKSGLASLLGAIDPLERQLNRLDALELKLAQSYRAGAIDADGYADALNKLKRQRDALTDGNNSTSTNTQSSSLMALAKPLLAAMSINEINKRSDAWTGLQNRLRGVTETNQQLAAATEQVKQAAMNAARPLESTAELYQRIATSGNKLSLTYKDIGRLTETVSKVITLDGLSDSQQNSLVEQIGRAFAAGTLEGQRFNTVLRQTPALTQAIAAGMGVTADSVLKMASQNKLSLEDVTDALKGQAEAIDEKYAKTQTTISSAFGVLNDSLTSAIGKLDQATESSNKLAQGLLNVAQGIDAISESPLDIFRSNGDESSLVGAKWNASVADKRIAELEQLLSGLSKETIIYESAAKELEKWKSKRDASQNRADVLSTAGAAAETPEAKAGTKYNAEYEKYLETLQKAESKVQKLSYVEQARADIASGRLGKLTEEQKKDLETQAQVADKLKENTKLETNLANLRRDAAVSGQKNSKTAAIQYEIENGWLKGATKEVQANALALAKQADAQRQSKSASTKTLNENQRFVDQLVKQATKRTEGAAALRAEEIATRNLTAAQREAAETANAAINAREFATQNVQLQLEYMRATGDTAGASLLQAKENFAQLRTEFEASGNTEGLSWLDKLLPVTETKIRVDDMKKQLDDLFTYQAQQETSIQAQVQGGLLSELQGRQRLIELHQEVGDKVKTYLPQLKEMADLPGEAGEKIREMIRQLEGQLGKLSQAGNELTVAFRDGLQSGIESSLLGLAKGTMSLSDAVRNLALSIVDSMAKIAAQQLAQMATSSLIGSSGGMGGMIGTLFAADGGHIQGAGTSTSDSIPAMLSNNEFVTRAAVVQQQGALDFLHDFNRHGMAALEGWMPRVRHSTGGLAGIPAPAAAAPMSLPETKATSPAATAPEQQLFQQTLVFDAGDAMSAGFNSLGGKRSAFTFLQANAPTIRQMLGVK